MAVPGVVVESGLLRSDSAVEDLREVLEEGMGPVGVHTTPEVEGVAQVVRGDKCGLLRPDNPVPVDPGSPGENGRSVRPPCVYEVARGCVWTCVPTVYDKGVTDSGTKNECLGTTVRRQSVGHDWSQSRVGTRTVERYSD